MNVDLTSEPIGTNEKNEDIYLKDIWPTTQEVNAIIDQVVTEELFRSKYVDVFRGDSKWAKIPVNQSSRYSWQNESTYIRKAPFFENIVSATEGVRDIYEARALAMLGDSVTTDHISPAGAIMLDSPAGQYLQDRGVRVHEFNSYGSRRGNHEVMVRGTFANIRLRNELASGTEGGWTKHMPSGEILSIYEASVRYHHEKTPLIVIAGSEYGSGSSRDWAAKGPLLLGVKAVIVESYERIHRSNLAGMGILPLQFKEGDSRRSLRLAGDEVFHIRGIKKGVKTVQVVAIKNDGSRQFFDVDVRIDSAREWDYYENGGILRYVLRQLAGLPMTKMAS